VTNDLHLSIIMLNLGIKIEGDTLIKNYIKNEKNWKIGTTGQ